MISSTIPILKPQHPSGQCQPLFPSHGCPAVAPETSPQMVCHAAHNAASMLFACGWRSHFSFERIMLILLVDVRFKSTLTHSKLDKFEVKTSRPSRFQHKTFSTVTACLLGNTYGSIGMGGWLQMAPWIFCRAFLRNTFRSQFYLSHFQVTFTCYKYASNLTRIIQNLILT